MIRSWASSRTRRFAESGRGTIFRGLDRDRALQRLALLDNATSLADIPRLGSIGLHALRGDRQGQWAMTINGPWRPCFRFVDGDAYDVEIVDYH
jgi:proteic killer suppression protein